MINGHGDDLYRYNRPISSNFSSNVFYAADLSGLKEYLCRQFASVGNYPEPEPYTLEGALAGHYGLPAGYVCVTNGATEAIYLIAQAFRGSSSAILVPTFSEYADACRMHGHRVTLIDSLEKIPEHADIVWVCNPNNPTGTVLDKENLLETIRRNPGVIFVFDHAYHAFTLKPVFTPTETLPFNVFQLYSMTKKYAIPGLRLGYVTASGELLQKLRMNRMPWSVNQLAIEAGLYILRNDVPHSIEMADYLNECIRLKKMLDALDTIEVRPTDTHFMLACLRKGTAKALKNHLANEYGFLIRDASNFEGLAGEYFRVAGRSPEENTELVTYIKEWLNLQ